MSIQICFLFTMLDNPQISEDTAKLLWTSQKWLLVSLLAARCGDQPSGGARRDRTDDLMLAKHALSQLSYGPKAKRQKVEWWAWEDSNFRPHAYQARALTN